MESILDAINEWIKEILIGAINGNLSTMFGDVNEKVGTIAAEVGKTPQGWNANIFNMIQNLSENVIVPIAGLVITYVLCYELISMVTEKNNMHGGAFEAGIIPVLNVLTMSLLMTVVLEYTQSLLTPIIMHFLWNSVGAIVLGGVSLADDYPNLLTATFSGNALLSGGIYKMEGSIIVSFVNIVLICLFVFLLIKQKKIAKS